MFGGSDQTPSVDVFGYTWETTEGVWSEPPNIAAADQVNFFSRITDAGGGVPMYADSAWVGSWPYSEGTPPPAPYEGIDNTTDHGRCIL